MKTKLLTGAKATLKVNGNPILFVDNGTSYEYNSMLFMKYPSEYQALLNFLYKLSIRIP